MLGLVAFSLPFFLCGWIVKAWEVYINPPKPECKGLLPTWNQHLWIVLNSLKPLVLYLKCGNLSGVLGLLVSIRWWFYILIDPRRLPKCLIRVVFLCLLKNTCLSSSFLYLFQTGLLPVRSRTTVRSSVHSFCLPQVSCSQPVRSLHSRVFARALLLSDFALWSWLFARLDSSIGIRA